MTSEIQHLLKEAAVDGDAIPLSLDHILRAGRRRRRMTSTLVATTVTATVGVVVTGAVLLPRPGHHVVGQIGGAAVTTGRPPDVTISSDGTITAIFHDPEKTADVLNALFRERGLKITVHLVAASPSLVGRMGSWGGSGNASSEPIVPVNSDKPCGWSLKCTVGVTIPAGFTGTDTLEIGRAARPGEQYNSSTDATTPGEVLACSNIIGATEETARHIIDDHGLIATWRGLTGGDVDPSSLSGQVVSGVTAIKLGTVFVKTEPKSEFEAYPAPIQPCDPASQAPY